MAIPLTQLGRAELRMSTLDLAEPPYCLHGDRRRSSVVQPRTLFSGTEGDVTGQWRPWLLEALKQQGTSWPLAPEGVVEVTKDDVRFGPTGLKIMLAKGDLAAFDPNKTTWTGGMCCLFTGDAEMIRRQQFRFASEAELGEWMSQWYPRFDQLHDTIGIPPKTCKAVLYVVEDSTWARKIAKWTDLDEEKLQRTFRSIHERYGENAVKQWLYVNGYTNAFKQDENGVDHVRVLYTSDIEDEYGVAMRMLERRRGKVVGRKNEDDVRVALLYDTIWLDMIGIKGGVIVEPLNHIIYEEVFQGAAGLVKLGYLPCWSDTGTTRNLPWQHVLSRANYQEYLPSAWDMVNIGFSFSATGDLTNVTREEARVALRRTLDRIYDRRSVDQATGATTWGWSNQDQQRVLSYQDFGLELLFQHMEAQGVSAQEAMRLPVVQSAFAELQRRLRIVPDEHDELIGRYLDVDGAMVRRCQQSLEELRDLVAAARALSELEQDNPFVAPLRRDLAEQNAQETTQLLNRLAAIESPAAQATMARSLAAINGGVVSAIVERSDSAGRWLGNLTLAILRGAGAPVSGEAAGVDTSLVREDLAWRGKDASSVLVEIASRAETPLNAFALRALAIADTARALEIARRLEDSGEHLHWLLEEAVRLILGRSEPAIKPHAHDDMTWTLEVVDTATKALWILSTPFLARSPLRSVIDLARDMEVRSYEHGAVLCRRGDASNEIYIVREGILHAFVDSAGERTSLHYIQSGDVVGELGVVTGSTRSCSVDVDSDRAMVMAIDHRTFNALLSHDALLSTSILRIVAERLIDRTEAVG